MLYPRLSALTVQQLETMPRIKEPGILYISKRFELAIHLCACGCGMETVTPIGNPSTGWTLLGNDDVVSLLPSILNRIEVCPSGAHYYVTDNQIQWL